MPAHFLTRFGGLRCLSLLLPLLLLIAQHGELLHELTHHAVSETLQHGGKPHPQAGHCDLCLAFAPIATPTAPSAVAVHLLDKLSFLRAAATTVSERPFERTALRNRGPPTLF